MEWWTTSLVQNKDVIISPHSLKSQQVVHGRLLKSGQEAPPSTHFACMCVCVCGGV